MMTLSISNVRAIIALTAYLLTANIANGLYTARSLSPSAGFLYTSIFAWFWIIGNWITTDCRQLGINKPLDVGWLVAGLWPVGIPYYLIWTRGFKGALVLLALVCLVVVTYIPGLLVFYMARSLYP